MALPFEVNLFGQVALTTALLPALVAAGGARLVFMSSVGGILAGPMMGPYAAGKFAVEGYNDVLRREVGRLGVDVIVIQPVTVRTPIWGKGGASMTSLTRRMTDEQRVRYDPLIDAMREQARQQDGRGVESSAAARVIVAAVEAKKPRTRYLIGTDAKVMAAAARLLSDRTVDWLIERISGLR